MLLEPALEMPIHIMPQAHDPGGPAGLHHAVPHVEEQRPRPAGRRRHHGLNVEWQRDQQEQRRLLPAGSIGDHRKDLVHLRGVARAHDALRQEAQRAQPPRVLRGPARIGAERLQRVSPGAAIEDHARFNAGALNFLRTIEVMAVSMLTLVLAATAGVVAFTARAGLSIHRRIVEIVHLVGAHDSYVARQFQAQAFRYGFVGAVIGTLLAALTLVAAGIFATRGGVPVGAVQIFEPWMIWPLAVIPLTAVLVAMVTVRIAVRTALRRMAY